MSHQIPWIQRTFDFAFSAGLYPELIERMRGTPARVEELARALPAGSLTRRFEDTWSIQENIGHLSDLEELFAGRLDEFEADAITLRPADMTNEKTHQTGHNERGLEQILTEFRSRREALVARLESQAPERFEQVAFHERLGVKMRLADMLYFQAEHDDHHIARMRWLRRSFLG